MSTRNLEHLFRPQSIALFGASDQPASVGDTLRRNLESAGFSGPVRLVNPHHAEIDGTPCHPDVESLPECPDLAILATPPDTIPGLVAELAERGTKAAVVITAGLGNGAGSLGQKMLDASRPHCLRVLGPNCVGVLSPCAGVNASFAHLNPLCGDLAFISQSGAVITSVMDWATARGIGFSHLVSLGDMADVDFGDLLDYLAADIRTRAILLYVEAITHARKFMSAARSAARAKPVVVIKAGRHAAAAKAATSHTGSLAGSDAVYDAAFQRAGMLRVYELAELFAAAETLTYLKPTENDRLAILTNGGGVGVLGTDCLLDFGGRLAELGPETMTALDQVLPPTWSRGNPVDIIGDAGPERYAAALQPLLDDPQVDAVVVMHCPVAIVSATDAAKAVVDVVKSRTSYRKKPVLTNWLGDTAVQEARRLFAEAGIATFGTPSDAMRSFRHLTSYAQAQRELMRTPPSLPEGFEPDQEAARKPIRATIQQNAKWMSEPDAKSVLSAYGIPTAPTRIAHSPAEVADAAAALMRSGDAPTGCVVKILSRDITHKSDVGGVRLNLESPEAAEGAAHAMLRRVDQVSPDAVIDGFTVQPMVRRTGAHELIIGMTDDLHFGPVILFGAGGTAVEVEDDTNLALPPLDLMLAHDLIAGTRVYRMLEGYRDKKGADLDAIAMALVRLSQLVTDFPEIRELDINPLLADEHGVIALDARMRVRPVRQRTYGPPGHPRFAIRPYPKEWEGTIEDRSGQEVLIRPVRPDDERLYDVFFDHLDKEDIRLRFFSPLKEFSHSFVARLTQIDYARAMAFVALSADHSELLGVSRLASDANYERAEYAVLVRSDLKGRGIGWSLMQRLIAYARAEGIQELHGDVLANNATMLKMCRKLGFQVRPMPDDRSIMQVVLPLNNADEQAGLPDAQAG